MYSFIYRVKSGIMTLDHESKVLLPKTQRSVLALFQTC